MRRAAERVDDQMRAYMQTRAIPGPWPAKRALAGVRQPQLRWPSGWCAPRAAWPTSWMPSGSPSTWRLTSTSDSRRLTRSASRARCNWPRSWAARASRCRAAPSPKRCSTYARKHNVTKIIVGKPIRPRWRELLRGSVVDQIIRQSGPIDVYVISGAPEARVPLEVAERLAPHRRWLRYLESVLLVVAGTLLSALVQPSFPPPTWS